jgi:hypothetical protein
MTINRPFYLIKPIQLIAQVLPLRRQMNSALESVLFQIGNQTGQQKKPGGKSLIDFLFKLRVIPYEILDENDSVTGR